MCADVGFEKKKFFFQKNCFFATISHLEQSFGRFSKTAFLSPEDSFERKNNYRKKCSFRYSRVWRKNVALLLKKSREVSQNCILSVLRIILKANNSFEIFFYRFRCLKKNCLLFVKVIGCAIQNAIYLHRGKFWGIEVWIFLTMSDLCKTLLYFQQKAPAKSSSLKTTCPMERFKEKKTFW